MSGTASRLHHASAPRTPAFELTASRQFTAWLAEQKASLAFTTYQAGKLFLLGLQPDGRLSIFERTFNRCMGLWASPERLSDERLYQLWRFENALPAGQAHQGYDRLYVPQLAWTTGDLDIHDIGASDDAERPAGVRQHAVQLPRHGQRERTASRRSGGRPSSAGWRPRTAAT